MSTYSGAQAQADVRLREDQLRLGLWMFLATVTMLFAAFTSAYIVRRSGSDWRQVALPSILWINTALLGASSIAVEFANHDGYRRRWARAAVGLGIGLGLGVAFLWGQALAWQELMRAGVYLPSNPHSSFFFVMTGAHGVHIVAALAVLGSGLVALRWAREDPVGWLARMELCRTFWHYLGVVWLALFALMSLY
jgi:cytochrome c oxidase subunit 3